MMTEGAPVLARGLRRLARSTAAVRQLSRAQDQQERRRLFVDEEMVRNLDHVLSQLKTRKLSLVEEPCGRVQAQGENLEFHFSAALLGAFDGNDSAAQGFEKPAGVRALGGVILHKENMNASASRSLFFST